MNPPPMLEATNICKTFIRGEDRITALDDVSLTLGKASFAAVAGPSGSGKSTLLNLLGTLDQPDSGVIRFDGEPVDHSNERSLEIMRARRLGFIFQHFNLIPVLTALENVEMPLYVSDMSNAERRQTAMAALHAVGLADRKDHRPNQLSGGQQQRVAVARALISKPDLVLADEPTANLESKSAFLLIEVMEKLHQDLGTSFLFSTHDQRIIERLQTVFVLEDGRLVS